MKKEINQKMSELLDGELDHAEEESLLQRIRQKPELNRKLNRYQAVSQALKTQKFVIPKESFLDKINQEIQQEPSYLLPQQKVNTTPAYLWQKTSLAIAASVAVVAVLVTQQTDSFLIESQPDAVMVKQGVEPTEENIQIASKLTNAKDANHERFKAYLQAHSDDLYTHGSLPYQPTARVVNLGQE